MTGKQKHVHGTDELMDLFNPDVVQIQISENGKRLWVNVDGVCRLRAYGIRRLDYLPLEVETEDDD